MSGSSLRVSVFFNLYKYSWRSCPKEFPPSCAVYVLFQGFQMSFSCWFWFLTGSSQKKRKENGVAAVLAVLKASYFTSENREEAMAIIGKRTETPMKDPLSSLLSFLDFNWQLFFLKCLTTFLKKIRYFGNRNTQLVKIKNKCTWN